MPFLLSWHLLFSLSFLLLVLDFNASCYTLPSEGGAQLSGHTLGDLTTTEVSVDLMLNYASPCVCTVTKNIVTVNILIFCVVTAAKSALTLSSSFQLTPESILQE